MMHCPACDAEANARCVSEFAAPTGSAVLQRQIEETEAAIKPLAKKLETLRRQKRDVDSRDFIAAYTLSLHDALPI